MCCHNSANYFRLIYAGRVPEVIRAALQTLDNYPSVLRYSSLWIEATCTCSRCRQIGTLTTYSRHMNDWRKNRSSEQQ